MSEPKPEKSGRNGSVHRIPSGPQIPICVVRGARRSNLPHRNKLASPLRRERPILADPRIDDPALLILTVVRAPAFRPARRPRRCRYHFVAASLDGSAKVLFPRRRAVSGDGYHIAASNWSVDHVGRPVGYRHRCAGCACAAASYPFDRHGQDPGPRRSRGRDRLAVGPRGSCTHAPPTAEISGVQPAAGATAGRAPTATRASEPRTRKLRGNDRNRSAERADRWGLESQPGKRVRRESLVRAARREADSRHFAQHRRHRRLAASECGGQALRDGPRAP